MKDDHEVVGLVVAETIARLWYIVDEVTSPCDCEYARAPEGGLMVFSKVDARWPRPPIDPEEPSETDGLTGLEGASFSEEWGARLTEAYGRPLIWRDLAGKG